jgi:hypothetical protein
MIVLDEERQLFVSDDSFVKGSQGRVSCFAILIKLKKGKAQEKTFLTR